MALSEERVTESKHRHGKPALAHGGRAFPAGRPGPRNSFRCTPPPRASLCDPVGRARVNRLTVLSVKAAAECTPDQLAEVPICQAALTVPTGTDKVVWCKYMQDYVDCISHDNSKIVCIRGNSSRPSFLCGHWSRERVGAMCCLCDVQSPTAR